MKRKEKRKEYRAYVSLFLMLESMLLLPWMLFIAVMFFINFTTDAIVPMCLISGPFLFLTLAPPLLVRNAFTRVRINENSIGNRHFTLNWNEIGYIGIYTVEYKGRISLVRALSGNKETDIWCFCREKKKCHFHRTKDKEVIYLAINKRHREILLSIPAAVEVFRDVARFSI